MQDSEARFAGHTLQWQMMGYAAAAVNMHTASQWGIANMTEVKQQ